MDNGKLMAVIIHVMMAEEGYQTQLSTVTPALMTKGATFPEPDTAMGLRRVLSEPAEEGKSTGKSCCVKKMTREVLQQSNPV